MSLPEPGSADERAIEEHAAAIGRICEKRGVEMAIFIAATPSRFWSMRYNYARDIIAHSNTLHEILSVWRNQRAGQDSLDKTCVAGDSLADGPQSAIPGSQ